MSSSVPVSHPLVKRYTAPTADPNFVKFRNNIFSKFFPNGFDLTDSEHTTLLSTVDPELSSFIDYLSLFEGAVIQKDGIYLIKVTAIAPFEPDTPKPLKADTIRRVGYAPQTVKLANGKFVSATRFVTAFKRDGARVVILSAKNAERAKHTTAIMTSGSKSTSHVPRHAIKFAPDVASLVTLDNFRTFVKSNTLPQSAPPSLSHIFQLLISKLHPAGVLKDLMTTSDISSFSTYVKSLPVNVSAMHAITIYMMVLYVSTLELEDVKAAFAGAFYSERTPLVRYAIHMRQAFPDYSAQYL
jgi:hypothetical protein